MAKKRQTQAAPFAAWLGGALRVHNSWRRWGTERTDVPPFPENERETSGSTRGEPSKANQAWIGMLKLTQPAQETGTAERKDKEGAAQRGRGGGRGERTRTARPPSHCIASPPPPRSGHRGCLPYALSGHFQKSIEQLSWYSVQRLQPLAAAEYKSPGAPPASPWWALPSPGRFLRASGGGRDGGSRPGAG